MTKKSPDNNSEHNNGTLGIHNSISDPQKIIEEKRDNSNWWLFLLILILIGFAWVYLLGSGILQPFKL